jgi:hypothetical protein
MPARQCVVMSHPGLATSLAVGNPCGMVPEVCDPRRFLMLAAAGAGALVAVPAAAETYSVSATNVLAVDGGGGLVQAWTATCEATDAAGDAVVTTTGKDLRFFAAPEQPLEAGVDSTVHSIADGATGSYEYAIVPGARVMARLTVRCGTSDVFDEATFDSAPVTIPPVIVSPVRVLDVDTLQDVPGAAIPLGATVELVGIEILANPRAAEVVAVDISGAGVVATLSFADADFVAGKVVISPQVTPTAVGDLVVAVRFEGVVAEALALSVVQPSDDGLPDGNRGGASDGGCGATGVGMPWVLGLLLWRRWGRRLAG